jgi:hypothetical protein
MCGGIPVCGEIETSVSLKVVDCAAEVMCKPSMMRDRENDNAPGPTLLASFSCGFPSGTPPQDALLSLNPTLRCYTSGDPADPSTWSPAGGVEPTFAPGERLAFSQKADAAGRVFTSWSHLMRPLKDASFDGTSYGFCTLEAWGDIAFTGMTEGEPADATCLSGPDLCPRRRDPLHIRYAPAVVWRGVFEWTGTAWDCHTSAEGGATPLTTVRRTVIDAAIHDTPDPIEKGVLPVTQTYALLSTEPRLAGQSEPYPSLVLRYAPETAFPESPMATPVGMVRRDLWVENGGVPLAVKVVKTCSEFDAVRVLQRIGVQLADSSTGTALGAVVIHRSAASGSTEPFECDRTTTGACELLDEAEWAPLTPCLAGP